MSSNNDITKLTDSCDAVAVYGGAIKEESSLHGHFTVKCYDCCGNLKWEDTIDNLVTTLGKNLALDTLLGNAAAGAVVMGLKGVGTAVVTDIQSNHALWLEVGLANPPTYTAPRKTPVFGAAVAGVKATSSPVIFIATGPGTIAGCFINIGGSATIDDTTGTLFSAGDFTAGNKIVTAGDTLSVSYNLTCL